MFSTNTAAVEREVMWLSEGAVYRIDVSISSLRIDPGSPGAGRLGVIWE